MVQLRYQILLIIPGVVATGLKIDGIPDTADAIEKTFQAAGNQVQLRSQMLLIILGAVAMGARSTASQIPPMLFRKFSKLLEIKEKLHPQILIIIVPSMQQSLSAGEA